MKNYGPILHSDVLHIYTGYRRFIEKASNKQDQISWYAFSIEIDNHTDIYCFGMNIRPLPFT